MRTLTRISLTTCLAVAPACLADAPSPEDLDLQPEDEAGPAATPQLPGNLATELPPEAITGGISYDSDVDVKVLNGWTQPYFCSGTLLRNDIILTARHCVTQDGLEEGPLVQDMSLLAALQDGAGDSFSELAFVEEIRDFGTNLDIALIRLTQNGFTVNDEWDGESVELWTRPDSDLVDQDVLCQGFGSTTCGTLGNFLRVGISTVFEETSLFLKIEPYLTSPWIPNGGDSGSACQAAVGSGLDYRRMGVVSWGPVCAPWPAGEQVVRLVRPSRFRDLVQSQVAAWEGDFLDDYSGSPAEVASVYEPAEDPSSSGDMWLVASDALWQFGTGYLLGQGDQEGTRRVYTHEVIENGTIEATFTGDATTAAGLVARVRGPDRYYRFSIDETAQLAKLVVRNGSSFQTLATSTLSGFDLSDSPRLAFELDGNSLTGYVDGVQVVTATDPAFTYLAGRAGVYSYDTLVMRIDDFGLTRM